jgi:hypothetical protein
MASRNTTPIDLTSEGSRTSSISAGPSTLSLPSAFGRMIAPGNRPIQEVLHRDKCKRPDPTYNTNYNPFNEPPKGQSGRYSPYVYREPL